MCVHFSNLYKMYLLACPVCFSYKNVYVYAVPFSLLSVLVTTLVHADVLKGFGTLDEASSLRAQYNVAFSKLLKSAIASIKQKVSLHTAYFP